MICAEDEIGIGNSHSGIIVLENEAKVGDSAINYLKLINDTIFDISLTPNRADAASHLGVARDLKASTGEEIILPESKIKVSWLYDLAKAINQINSLYLEVGAIHGTVLCLENKPLPPISDNL